MRPGSRRRGGCPAELSSAGVARMRRRYQRLSSRAIVDLSWCESSQKAMTDQDTRSKVEIMSGKGVIFQPAFPPVPYNNSRVMLPAACHTFEVMKMNRLDRALGILLALRGGKT